MILVWRSDAPSGNTIGMTFEARMLWGVVAGSALTASLGCATTGLGWVNEPESGGDVAPPSSDPISSAPRQAFYPAEGVAVAPSVQRSAQRRLDHTITLGEVTVLDARPEAAPSPQGSVVNIYVSPSAPAPGYAGYVTGYGFATAPFANVPIRGVRVNTAAPPMRPGLDWPSVPSPGTPFPYRTAPASPWEGSTSRRR
jgi:hypothetical protein